MMHPHNNFKSFIFNKNFDAPYIFSLYEDDLPYIEEIFGLALSQLQVDIPALTKLIDNGQWKTIYPLIHKLKPSFGFVGMLNMQQACAEMEKKCRLDSDTNMENIFAFMNMLSIALKEVEEEYSRIKQYNSKTNA